MSGVLRCVTPVDGSVYVERPLADPPAVDAALAAPRAAQADWRRLSVADRAPVLLRMVEAMTAKTAAVAEEITWQMGRPIAHSPFEMRGFEERARYMIGIAKEALADVDAGPKEGFRRFVRRNPLGVVVVIAPWNYPYLTAVNAVVPALMAGNAVVVKHSHQTPLCAERLVAAGREAGLPDGLLQFLHLDHEGTEALIRDPRVDFVCFTGSVAGGRRIAAVAAERMLGVGLELGGKDPAYVRADANLDHAVENLTDGAFFNAGQSCCGIERIYVDRSVYRRFVDGVVDLTRTYRLGSPVEKDTNLGPMVRPSAANFVRAQTAEAVAAGAKALIDPKAFPADDGKGAYLAPQVLVDVDHSMRVMTEESFGPVVGIMPVSGDEEAIRLMNDSAYGLTAAIWTSDEEAAIAIGERIETGTWFMNRCDYLDPALAWTGVKDSGRGATLSKVGYETLTRPKSYHLRMV